MSASPQPGKVKPKKGTSPAKSFTWGFFFLLVAVVMYFYIGNAEQSGDSFTLPIILTPVYKMIGKRGIVGVLAAAGLMWFALGASDLRTTRRAVPTAPNVEHQGAE